MAARFIVALAFIALSHANPFTGNGNPSIYRDERGFSIGEAYSNGELTKATANVNGGNAQAFGSSTNGGQLARNGFYYPINYAKAEAFDNAENFAYGPAKAIAQAQNNGANYGLPAPATVITYEQKFESPEAGYVIPAQDAIYAKSTATSDGASDSSISSASTNGAGVAESSAQTQKDAGSYGVTSTNTKVYGNSFGSAASNAKNGFGSTVTSAKTNGYGSASSAAETKGTGGFLTPVDVSEDHESTVISAKFQGSNTGYINPGYGSASSNANVNGLKSSASSSANTNYHKSWPSANTNYHKSWRFGTLYDRPASAYSQANIHPGYGVAKSTVNNGGYGSANADAKINGAGYGSTNSAASTNGYGAAKSSANTNGVGYGSANANADVNTAGYNSARSTANTNGNGSVLSLANTDGGYGSAKATANTQGTLYAGRLAADAQTRGFGDAKSTANSQGLSTGYKVAQSSANSYGQGSANAKAQSA